MCQSPQQTAEVNACHCDHNACIVYLHTVHLRGHCDEPAVQQQGGGHGAQGRGGLRQDRLGPRRGAQDVRQAL